MGSDIPAGFRPYSEPSPFIDRVGPLYQRQEGQKLVFGLRVIAHHCNRRGFAHGGVIMSLADIALGKTGEWTGGQAVSLLTASITVDLLGIANLNDWLEAHTDFFTIGRQVAFANCYVRVEGRPIARASAVFNVRRHETPDTPA
ncbi:MAG: PaaI family thioesterase [SAR324 cluster bacterium]|nr:PaaI family thioesterase [SAR324 cluster bacterium]